MAGYGSIKMGSNPNKPPKGRKRDKDMDEAIKRRMKKFSEGKKKPTDEELKNRTNRNKQGY